VSGGDEKKTKKKPTARKTKKRCTAGKIPDLARTQKIQLRKANFNLKKKKGQPSSC